MVPIIALGVAVASHQIFKKKHSVAGRVGGVIFKIVFSLYFLCFLGGGVTVWAYYHYVVGDPGADQYTDTVSSPPASEMPPAAPSAAPAEVASPLLEKPVAAQDSVPEFAPAQSESGPPGVPPAPSVSPRQVPVEQHARVTAPPVAPVPSRTLVRFSRTGQCMQVWRGRALVPNGCTSLGTLGFYESSRARTPNDEMAWRREAARTQGL